jgi:hypothetical protein
MKPDKRISIKDYRWWKTPKIQIVQTLFSSIRQYYVRMNLKAEVQTTKYTKYAKE